MAGDLARSLIEAATLHGATVVVISGGGNGHTLGHVASDVPALTPHIHTLADGETKPVQVDEGLRVGSMLEMERNSFNREKAALTSQIKALRAELDARSVSTATSEVPIVTVEQPDSSTSVDAFDIDVLGLEAKLGRKLAKNGYKTVGDLRTAYLDGLSDDALKRLTKDQRIEIGMRLLGKVPAERLARQYPVAAAPQTLVAVGPVDGVPEGFVDREWMKRVNVTLVKRDAYAECQDAIEEFAKSNKALVGRFAKGANAVYADLLVNAAKAEAQVIMGLYCLGLDQSQELEEAFNSAGLGHLLPAVEGD